MWNILLNCRISVFKSQKFPEQTSVIVWCKIKWKLLQSYPINVNWPTLNNSFLRSRSIYPLCSIAKSLNFSTFCNESTTKCVHAFYLITVWTFGLFDKYWNEIWIHANPELDEILEAVTFEREPIASFSSFNITLTRKCTLLSFSSDCNWNQK